MASKGSREARRRHRKRWKENRSRRQQCERKVRYGNEQDAINAAFRMVIRYHKLYVEYECRFCQGWHVATEYHDARRHDRHAGLMKVICKPCWRDQQLPAVIQGPHVPRACMVCSATTKSGLILWK